MSDPFEGRPFPRGVLIGAAALIAFVIAAAGLVRLTGVGGSEVLPAAIVEARELVFIEQGEGVTLVAIPGAGAGGEDAVLAELHSGVDGFVLGVMRGMVRERKASDIPEDAPYLLALHEGGRLTFGDPATGREIDVGAFGHTNFSSFARLLRAEPIAAIPATSTAGRQDRP